MHTRYLSRAHEILVTRAHDIVSRAHDLVIRAHDIVEINKRKYACILCATEVVSCYRFVPI